MSYQYPVLNLSSLGEVTDCYCPHSFILSSAEGRTELLE